ncbi:division/cell wall cluster transcriptional repressor MraZ [Elusimicrobiota bacterium]
MKSGGKLIGQYSRNIDTKRRIFIPSEFRITSSWVITLGLEQCLFLFPDKEWNRITDRIKNLPLTKKDARSFLRVLLSRARSITCDSQGRIIVPEFLVKYSDITDSCISVGMLDRIELWNPESWKKYFDNSQRNYSELAENIAELDL